ncbi:hypothetical protein BYT27DRAFT_7124518 [Phlegmacium glaucopus]|nr:hypothetical protein BYT27DRAFT_7124518 [Phlegmacium glaucopus]
MDASQCSIIDTALKHFKLLSRQLHPLLVTHATELQILQRLYYKNKNQHRGSLFWRKVVEVRRYSERFEQHKTHILIDDFRCTFYGPGVHNTSSLKGPWTHFPDANYISSTSNKIKNSVCLLEKHPDHTINRSFHRSMQSAAFLPVLLMFISISSRMRVLCLELQNILQQVVSNIASLLPTVMVSFLAGSDKVITYAQLINTRRPPFPPARPNKRTRRLPHWNPVCCRYLVRKSMVNMVPLHCCLIKWFNRVTSVSVP